jgi:Ca-activated chloride channel family protein
MHDLVMPQKIAMLPQTSGWIVVGLWLLGMTVLLVMKVVVRYRENRYRREALKSLHRLRSQTEADSTSEAQEIAVLLKRTALAAYPRTRVASLHGSDWAEFLTTTTNDDPAVASAAPSLGRSSYDPDADSADLYDGAEAWIRKHRA